MGKPVPVMKCIWRKHQQCYLEILLPHIDELKAANPDIQIIDIQKVFMQLNKEECKKLYQEDGLHPNEDGAKLIAKTVCQCLRDCL